jgi:hypothetical protein
MNFHSKFTTIGKNKAGNTSSYYPPFIFLKNDSTLQITTAIQNILFQMKNSWVRLKDIYTNLEVQ